MVSYGNPVGDLGVLNCSEGHFLWHPEHYKLVIFTGGEDVDPSLYNDTSPRGLCRYNSERDNRERKIFQVAKENGIKMTGICRGAQFLTVMTGGRLMHDITGHAGRSHNMVWSLDTKKTIVVNSLHHQMCVPGKGSYIVGWSPERISMYYMGKNDEKVNYPGPEVEAIIFPAVKAFAVQYHPEMMAPNSDGWRYYHDAVKDLLELTIEEFVNKYRGTKNVQTEPTKHTENLPAVIV
jgi:putative glutamine amidotransferase